MSDDLSSEIKHLSERLRESPESRLFAPLADAYRKSGQLDKAIELCESGLEKFPEYASAHVILGKCFYDKGATERSKAEFDRVLEIDSENMVALKFLGDIMLAENSYDEARKYFDRLLVIDPTNEEVLEILKEMEKDFQVREIDLEDEETVKKVEQPREMATMTLAGIYASQGYYAKALGMYRDILGAEPDNGEAKSMIEKLESMIDSSEKDRGEAFEEEVLTISVDDVGREIIENSVGHGTADAEMEPTDPGEDEKIVKRDEEAPEEEVEEVPEEKEDQPQEEKHDDSEADAPVAEKTPEEMDHFQQWLRKMQGSSGGDSGSES